MSTAVEVPDNVFDLVAHDPELVNDAKEVQEALNSEQAAAGSTSLKVAAAAGVISFRVGKVKGSGVCNKKGLGGFKGPDPGTHTQGGEFELDVSRTKAVLTLKSNGAVVFGPATYTGLEKGITGNWTGTWS